MSTPASPTLNVETTSSGAHTLQHFGPDETTRKIDGLAGSPDTTTTWAPVDSPVPVKVQVQSDAATPISTFRCRDANTAIVYGSERPYVDGVSDTVPLTGMPGQSAVGLRECDVRVELRMSPNKPWETVGQRRVQVFRTLATPPRGWPMRHQALEKACEYARDLKSKKEAAAAIRSGPREVDGLKYDPARKNFLDPLRVYTAGIGQCQDYAQLTLTLARTLGLEGSLIKMWGGVKNSEGKELMVVFGGAIGLLNFEPGESRFGPTAAEKAALASIREMTDEPSFGAMAQAPSSLERPARRERPAALLERPAARRERIAVPARTTAADLSPRGFAFTTHYVARIEGEIQDAALVREGISGEVFRQGMKIRLAEVAKPPSIRGVVGKRFEHFIERENQPVELVQNENGAPGGIFPNTGKEPLPLEIPRTASASRPFEYPGSLLLVKDPARQLVPDLECNFVNGAPYLTGTPSAPGEETIEATFNTAELTGERFDVKIEVDPA